MTNSATYPLRTERASLDRIRKLAAEKLLYAILDSCDAPAVLQKVEEIGPDRACSLYRDTAQQRMPAIAPYLVIVDVELLGWIAASLWTQPWGVFLGCGNKLDDVRKHLRRFLVVRAPCGEELLFRYYDPRILRTYFATSTAEELLCFFGPIRMFAIPESQTFDVILSLRASDSPTTSPPKGVVQIRNEQFAAFAAQAQAAFANRVLLYLRGNHAERVSSVNDDQLRSMVIGGLDRARRHGLTGESALTAFVTFMFEFAPNFDQHPHLRQLLSDRSMPPNARLARMSQVVSDQEWEEVRRMYDPRAWLAPQGDSR